MKQSWVYSTQIDTWLTEERGPRRAEGIRQEHNAGFSKESSTPLSLQQSHVLFWGLLFLVSSKGEQPRLPARYMTWHFCPKNPGAGLRQDGRRGKLGLLKPSAVLPRRLVLCSLSNEPYIRHVYVFICFRGLHLRPLDSFTSFLHSCLLGCHS